MSEVERRLEYDDTFMFEIEEVVNTSVEYTDVMPFSDQSTEIELAVSWSQEQYTRILSALMTGADLMYPYQTQQVVYDFLKMTEDIMSCDEVADCIETSQAVVDALLAQLSANGYAPGGNSAENTPTNVTMSPAQSAENLLPPDYVCSDNQIMATARAIVQKFDKFAQDFFDNVELLTNPLEVGEILTDGVPIADTINNGAAFVDWMAQTVRETYQASYTEGSETEIACALYCAMKPDCELTHAMLIDVLDALQVLEYPPIPTQDNFQEIVDWAMALPLEVSTATVAAFHLLLALAMRFGDGVVFDMAGLTSLKSVVGQTVGLLDTSWVDCDCAEETPTDYWMIYKNMTQGLGEDWVIGSGTLTGQGVQSITSSGRNTATVRLNDLGGSFSVKAAGVINQRRGSIGSAANDFVNCNAYTGINNTGTGTLVTNVSGITCNTNECDYQNVLAGVAAATQSLAVQTTASGTLLYPTRFNTIVEVVFYGLCNTGQVKPAMAVYVDAIPAVGSLFPTP